MDERKCALCDIDLSKDYFKYEHIEEQGEPDPVEGQAIVFREREFFCDKPCLVQYLIG